MKRIQTIPALLLACLLLLLPCWCAGCDWSSAGGGSGAASSGEVWRLERAGVSVPVPPIYHEHEDLIYLEPMEELYEDDGVSYGFINLYPASLEALDGMSEDEVYAISGEISFPAIFFGINGGRGAEELSDWMRAQGWDELADDLTEAGRADDWTFFRVRFDEMMREYEGETGAAAKAVAEAMDKAVCTFFPPVSASSYTSGAAGTTGAGDPLSFTTTDLDGNTVDSAELFASAEITMVNIWTSWCGYCVREMPELEAMNARLAEKGCRIVGILYDGDTASGLSDGRDVITQTGVTYQNLLPTAEIVAAFPVQGFPTTFFVDSEGRIVGNEIIGAQPESYEPAVDKLLGK